MSAATLNRVRLTSKQKVLKKHPNARQVYVATFSGNEVISPLMPAIALGAVTILGQGKTWAKAWANAAKHL